MDWKNIYPRLEGFLRRLARKNPDMPADTQDALQDAVVQALVRAKASPDGVKHPEAFIKKAAEHRMLDRRRKASRTSIEPSEVEGASDQGTGVNKLLARLVIEGLVDKAALHQDDRALLLGHLHGGEVDASVSPKNRKRLSRLIKRLRRMAGPLELELLAALTPGEAP